MPIINGKPFTQFTNVNVLDTLLVNGQAFTARTLLTSASTALDQQPSSLDAPIQIEFGPTIVSDKVILGSDGSLNFAVSQGYLFNIWLQLGRTGAAGVSRIFVRALLNGQNIPTVPPFVAEIDNANSIYTDQFRGNLAVSAGDVITFELVRDSSGNNSGGLLSANPALPDWPFAPTARITISEFGVGD